LDARSAPPFEIARDDGLLVSTDPARLDLDAIHGWISHSYWAAGIPRETMARALAGSLCFGLYSGGRQIGLARVITDGATFAYLCDVYVDDAHQRRGLGTWFMECLHQHPMLQGLRRLLLATRDAHGLYRRVGYAPLARPDGWMEKHRANAYQGPAR
jgi:GNAT superfamily N-acetyltransferase